MNATVVFFRIFLLSVESPLLITLSGASVFWAPKLRHLFLFSAATAVICTLDMVFERWRAGYIVPIMNIYSIAVMFFGYYSASVFVCLVFYAIKRIFL
jgi:hypothetical protein